MTLPSRAAALKPVPMHVRVRTRLLGTRRHGMALHAELWAAQVVLGLASSLLGAWMLAASIDHLIEVTAWAGGQEAGGVRLLGAINLAGGLGLLWPVWRRRPSLLSPAAAAGCMALHGLAIGFHLARGAVQDLPLNLVLLSMSLFVLWGLLWRVPQTDQ